LACWEDGAATAAAAAAAAFGGREGDEEEVAVDIVDANAPPCWNACAKQMGGATTTPPSWRLEARLGMCVTLNLSNNVVLPTPGAPTINTFNCVGAK
jgi:hypothetical protein